ncbi:IS110 family transposase [Paenibacillus donghaensis]|nr:hypothetical protein [Paenibacillus donghaensis]MBE9915626.1 IS110 family transposase [Paenibacillus donghaensis]
MNPVIGLDVSKGESHAQAFTDRGVPYGKVLRFEHNLEGLVTFLLLPMQDDYCDLRKLR